MNMKSRVVEVLSNSFTAVDEVCKKNGLGYSGVMSLLRKMEAEGVVQLKEEKKIVFELNKEGEKYLKNGTPEMQLMKKLKGKTPLENIKNKIGLQWALKNKWAKIVKKSGKTYLEPSEKMEGGIDILLKKVADGEALNQEEVKILKHRKLILEKEAKKFFVKKIGEAKNEVTGLTPQMLKSGSWKNKTFKKYNLSTLVAPLIIGKKHFYLQLLRRIKEELIGLGFTERRGPLIETEFWNMDVLFMAQHHPARDIHDVFKLKYPKKGKIENKELIKRVREVHEHGGAGKSIGWKYKWEEEIARQLVLRSQTTCVSARALSSPFVPPLRIFSIGKVFRPDEINWNHFIEFNQCEGIVADEKTNFRELLGYLKSFATEIFGVDEVKFAPSYFPFTEPSIEMFVKIGEKGWVEVAGAGMFRPEVLEMLKVEVPVLAWGIGIDRFAMLKLGITDIRDIHSEDLKFLRDKW